MTVKILRGNVFDVLPTIKPGSVDCCVTSPPYWMLRSYLPKDHPLKPLELGSEPTPAAFVENQVKVFRLVRDCLAPHGTCWLNVGDTYSGSSATGGRTAKQSTNVGSFCGNGIKDGGVDAGNLCLIPWRLALALQDDGWLVRSVVVWHKPAPMPSSVSGWRWMRCRRKESPQRKGADRKVGALGHRDVASLSNGDGRAEWSDCPGCRKCTPNGGYVLRRGSWRPTSSWEPVLMLAKGSGYYCDGEAVKTPSAAATVSRNAYTRILDDPDEQFAVKHDHETVSDGANLRDVWTIAAEPLRERHYAAFPSELVYRCLAAGTSSKGYCPSCGRPWARVVGEQKITQHRGNAKVGGDKGVDPDNRWNGYPSVCTSYDTLGWRPTCPHADQPPRPALVLDPFAGSGRTGVQALRLGCDFVGVELNPEYATMAERLLYDSSPLFSQ